MNLEELTLEKHLKRTTKVSSAIAGTIATLGSLAVVYGFYYNTQGTLNEHSESINKVQSDVVDIQLKISESAVFEGVTKAQYKALEDKVNSIDTKMDKMGDKLDLILIKK
jgi:predicted amino acid racemase